MSTIHSRREAREWQVLHDATAPRVGHVAPDFELRDVSGERTFRLSAHRGERPVALRWTTWTTR